MRKEIPYFLDCFKFCECLMAKNAKSVSYTDFEAKASHWSIKIKNARDVSFVPIAFDM